MYKTVEQQEWKARRSRRKIILSVMDVSKPGVEVCRALSAIAALGSGQDLALGSGTVLSRDLGML